MIPERYDALVARGARYGYSRIVLVSTTRWT